MKNKLKLVLDPDPILREISKPVNWPLSKEDKELAHDMHEYIKWTNSLPEDNEEVVPAIGIAAVQVGYLKRMFILHVYEDNEELFSEVLINPEITEHGDVVEMGEEHCLSVEEFVEGNVWRYEWTRVKWTDLEGNTRTRLLKGLINIAFQHEYDHLDGILYYDKIKSSK